MNQKNDQNYIMNCDMPSQLFTVKGIRKEYRALAKAWHPDVASGKEALFVMSKINALYKEGISLIEANRFYEKERALNRGKKFEKAEQPTKRSKSKRVIELKTPSGKCIRFKYLKRVMIELGFLYVSEGHVMLEITKLKRKIYMDAIEAIRHLGEGYFKLSVPNVIDSFETQTHGYVVIKKAKGVEPVVTLELFSGYLKPLASRKICEGIFYDLTALKHIGLTSTGLDKSLLLIDVNTGKLYNYGLFFYLHEFSASLSRAPKEVGETLRQLKPKSSEALIIEMVKSTVEHLNAQSGGIVDDFHEWIKRLNSDSLEASLAESQVFNRSIASVTNHGFDLDAYYAHISS